MYIKKHWIVLSILLIPCIGDAQEIKIDESWLRQSLNVIGRTGFRSGPGLTNDLYPEYTVAGRKDWFDFHGYVGLSKFSGTNGHYDVGIWGEGSPLFTEIEPWSPIDKLAGLNFAFDPSKEWFIANNYIYDMGDSQSSRRNTWYTGLGIDIDTGLPTKLSANTYAKYRWQNYGAADENEWDRYRFKIKYSVPLTNLLGGRLVYNSFASFDFGSGLADKSRNNKQTSNTIALNHILSLLYEHWKFASTLHYFHNSGQQNAGEEVNLGDGPLELKNTGWRVCAIIGYRS